MFTKILACTDGSERALAAVRAAAAMAKRDNASLTVLHVVRPPAMDDAFPGAENIAKETLERYAREMHEAVLSRTLPAVEEMKVRFSVLEKTGDPVWMITSTAQMQGFDLIVLGSRGVSVSEAAHLGSVSYGVVQGAHCPVLIVR